MEGFEKNIRLARQLEKFNIEKSIVGTQAFYINEDIIKGMAEEDILLKSKNGGYFDNDTLEKGKPAQVGEVRDWNGVKYRKVASGKWEEVRTTGRESVNISVGGKGTATQRAASLSKKVDRQEREQKRRKEQKSRLPKLEERKEELESDIRNSESDLRGLKRELKQSYIDMEQEVSQAPEEEKDHLGGQVWGKILGDLEENIENETKKLKKLESDLESLELEMDEIWDY